MIELQLGRPVRWINPKTGGWELGRVVECPNHRDLFFDKVLVAGTFGGHFIVDANAVEWVRPRDQWEQQYPSPEGAIYLGRRDGFDLHFDEAAKEFVFVNSRDTTRAICL